MKTFHILNSYQEAIEKGYTGTKKDFLNMKEDFERLKNDGSKLLKNFNLISQDKKDLSYLLNLIISFLLMDIKKSNNFEFIALCNNIQEYCIKYKIVLSETYVKVLNDYKNNLKEVI